MEDWKTEITTLKIDAMAGDGRYGLTRFQAHGRSGDQIVVRLDSDKVDLMTNVGKRAAASLARQLLDCLGAEDINDLNEIINEGEDND